MRRLVAVTTVAVTSVVVLAGGVGAFGIKVEPLPTAATRQPYEYQVRVHGGNPPYTFTARPNTLPPGLVLGAGGRLGGVPSQTGTWRFYIEASYRYGTNPPVFSQRQFTLVVVTGLSIRNRSLPAATARLPYTARLSASGGGMQSWSLADGSLPPGLRLTKDGRITGAPRRAGAFAFTVAVTDDFRVTQRQLGLTVVTAPTVVAAAARLPAAVVGSSFEARLRVVGGLAPYSWELSAARRPPGLTLSGGVLAGRPLVAGRYVFDVVVRDGAGSRASHRVALTVLPRVKIPAQALAPGAVGAPYRGTIRARGGAVPLAYTVVEGSLPPGITLDRRTGALVGAPARPGRYSFAIGVGDRSGGMHRRTFVLRIR